LRRVSTRLTFAAAILALAGPLLTGTEPAAAAEWPTKPVKVIVPYAAGNGGDVITRRFADGLSKKFGQPFVVDNRAGAAGSIGTEIASKSTPDGYTFLSGPNAPIVLVPQLRKVGYDPHSLEPVAPLGEYVYGLGVLPALGPKTMKEFVELAKSKPGQLTYSSPGPGSATNLRGESLKVLAGIDLVHVPYGSQQAVVDFLGGRLDLIIDNAVFPHVRSGSAKLLAVTASRRHPDFPDIPTLEEAGYPIDLPTYCAFFAPKGTPADIIERLNTAVREVGADPEVQSFLYKVGFYPMNETATELVASNERAIVSYADWVKKTDLKLE
jgi:tripartite-type tricarboxylate transporter receptor subunit TctC